MAASADSPSFSTFLTQLVASISPGAKVLTEQSSTEFKDSLQRWSDIGLQIPTAIVLVATENDVVLTVKLAVELNIPFVPKSGGHSLWSTIGPEGFILDLSRLKNVSLDKERKTVTVGSGVLIKEVNETAFQHGLCLPLGNGNTIGVVPQALGGGISALSGLCGYTSDSIVSARVVTSSGSMITVSSSSHPDLFWALRGAGQFFGIVTELIMQAYPLSVLGTPDGTVWTGSIVFPAQRAEAVLQALAPMIADESAPGTGLFLIAAPPPTFTTCIIIIPVFFGPVSVAEAYYQSLISLGPLMMDCKPAFCSKGGFKRFAGAGMQKFEPSVWPKVIELFEELRRKCPDAGVTGYNKLSHSETAFSHKDVKVWAPESHAEVYRIEQEVLSLMRQDQNEEDEAAFQNWTRDEPLRRRYRGAERLEKLKRLKKEWDPNGIFTAQLL
ncbi:hypothetical protein B0H16DRAFT_1677853 [Mycena metata]|uniref:FAD-binding PCMH-type domain-containing protein n=1 Tax=Mycena metata TaxID=1033252 RepID=A0AAD7HK11_9AGAR|nr:hypothetical protein B0H16DRAFT_1677853 [Mycena metata]